MLHVGENARIIRGFQEGVTVEQISEAAGTDRIKPLLRSLRPQVADTISVPPGVVHAIGPDVVVFEVQQNSDLTYRLHDWGRPRELHIEKGLRALRLVTDDRQTVAPETIDENSAWLIRAEHFRVRRYAIRQPRQMVTEGSFKLLTVWRGLGTLGWRSGGEDPPLQMHQGDTALIPACCESVFLSPVGAFEFLWTDAGDSTA